MREARVWQLKGDERAVARSPDTKGDEPIVVEHELGQRQPLMSKALVTQALEHRAPLSRPGGWRAEQAEVEVKELKGELRGAALGLSAKGDRPTPPNGLPRPNPFPFKERS